MRFGSNDQRLADITNTLCYCFTRATKGVSYAAPSYIADRMCERGRTWLKPWTPDRAFRLPPTNNGIPLDDDSIKQWKRDKALELSRTTTLGTPENPSTEHVWGGYNEYPANGPVRLVPWHRNLDHLMFWM
jgi:hypothetical protein